MLDWIAEHPLYPLLALGTGFSVFWLVKKRAELQIGSAMAVILGILHTLIGVVSVKVFAFLEGAGPGAMSLFGAVFFLPLLYLLGAKLFRRRAVIVCDVFTPCVIFTLLCARINCLFSGCCLGHVIPFVTNRTLRWPTREAEILFYVILLAILIPKAFPFRGRWHGEAVTDEVSLRKTGKVSKGRLATIPGTLYPFYMACYGIFRFVIEFFRESEATGIFHISHLWAAIAFCIGGAIYWEISMKTKKKKQ